jgi:hypothetical protein
MDDIALVLIIFHFFLNGSNAVLVVEHFLHYLHGLKNTVLELYAYLER